MHLLRKIVIHHYEKVLTLVIILSVLFFAILPRSSWGLWVIEAVLCSLLVYTSFILGQSNKSLQRFKEALHTTMDPSVVKLLIDKNLRTENRPISVQFTDLKGFTSYAEEKSAEVVLSELNAYLREMETILLQYNAHIDKYMGDGIMSEFGAPNTYIKHSLLAVACGWKMQHCMLNNHYPWPLRVGIATGVSTIGIIGTKRQAYTAFGDVVNLASRIEGLCEPGKVTVDEKTYLECKDYFDFKQLSFSALNQLESEELSSSINRASDALEKSPNDPTLLMELASLLIEERDTQGALDLLTKAMSLEPENDEIKLAFANASLKHNEQLKLEVRGRKKPIKVYEVIALKCPLANFKSIPKMLYEEKKELIEKLVVFPEDLILPIESLDGSIGQAKLVGIVSFLIADKMGLAESEQKNILEAAYLADIGKAVVPESVLNRPGQLTEDEIKFIHLHPTESVRKLVELGYSNNELINIIACHHESANGRGYPEGRSDTDIPIGSKILAVAEAYVSLTSNRPYRDAWEVNIAFQEILKYSKLGKFNPDVTAILGEIVNEL